MRSRKKLLFLTAIVILSLLPIFDGAEYGPGDIPYNDCGGSDHNQLAKVRVTGCEEDVTCNIRMGDVLTLTVKWKTSQTAILKLEGKVEIQFFLGFKTEVAVSPIDACQYLKCPLKKNTEIEYVANFTVPTEAILPGEGRIWWKGYGQSQNDLLLCVNFLVNIQN